MKKVPWHVRQVRSRQNGTAGPLGAGIASSDMVVRDVRSLLEYRYELHYSAGMMIGITFAICGAP